MKETLIRWKNKIRIIFKKIFTNQVREFDIKDDKGKKHRITVEQTKEKVNDPEERLKKLTTILFQSENDPNQYYIIPYKIELKDNELYEWVENIANHFHQKFEDLIEEDKGKSENDQQQN